MGTQPHPQGAMGLNAAWSMAVGGMVGGGIFSTLGVVIAIAGPLAWLSFLVAGLIALAAGYAYAHLTAHYRSAGGAFAFLGRAGAPRAGGALAWLLLAGYVLTNAVYAFTFGQYLGHVAGLGPWFARAAAVGVMALFVGLNLRSAGQSSAVEIVLVWFKLAVLVALAGIGLAHWSPALLARGVPDAGPRVALFGAAAVFMAYEGFQLLAYDYGELRDAERTLPRAMLGAIAVVIVLYVAIALGVPMLVGADAVVRQQEVALAIAGRQAAGVFGLWVVTVAAAFSTGSAINSTLFATARLAHQVTRAGQLPAAVDHLNRHRVPDRAVIALGGLAAAGAAIGTLGALVEAASLAFLFTFTVVCALACRIGAGSRWITAPGAAASAAATLVLLLRLWRTEPLALAVVAALVLLATAGRAWLLRHVRTADDG